MLKLLKKSLVKDMQITLDGMAKTHDVRRPLRDVNSGTFHHIMQNLVDGKDILPEKVSLRINVDEDNIYEAYDLVDFLERVNLKGYVSPYLGKVENYNNCYVDTVCLTESKYSKGSIDFLGKAYSSLEDFHLQVGD